MEPISTTLRRWAVASLLALVAFAAAFAVASNTGGDEPPPARATRLRVPATSPLVNNLERSVRIKPLRHSVGGPPAPAVGAQP